MIFLTLYTAHAATREAPAPASESEFALGSPQQVLGALDREIRSKQRTAELKRELAALRRTQGNPELAEALMRQADELDAQADRLGEEHRNTQEAFRRSEEAAAGHRADMPRTGVPPEEALERLPRPFAPTPPSTPRRGAAPATISRSPATAPRLSPPGEAPAEARGSTREQFYAELAHLVAQKERLLAELQEIVSRINDERGGAMPDAEWQPLIQPFAAIYQVTQGTFAENEFGKGEDAARQYLGYINNNLIGAREAVAKAQTILQTALRAHPGAGAVPVPAPVPVPAAPAGAGALSKEAFYAEFEHLIGETERLDEIIVDLGRRRNEGTDTYLISEDELHSIRDKKDQALQEVERIRREVRSIEPQNFNPEIQGKEYLQHIDHNLQRLREAVAQAQRIVDYRLIEAAGARAAAPAAAELAARPAAPGAVSPSPEPHILGLRAAEPAPVAQPPALEEAAPAAATPAPYPHGEYGNISEEGELIRTPSFVGVRPEWEETAGVVKRQVRLIAEKQQLESRIPQLRTRITELSQPLKTWARSDRLKAWAEAVIELADILGTQTEKNEIEKVCKELEAFEELERINGTGSSFRGVTRQENVAAMKALLDRLSPYRWAPTAGSGADKTKLPGRLAEVDKELEQIKADAEAARAVPAAVAEPAAVPEVPAVRVVTPR